ncbi:hypothetical protein GCM10029992_52150 [Glycomyces albus]
MWIVNRQVGIDVPRFSEDLLDSGDSIGFDEVLPGDLVFFEHGGDPRTPAIVAERGQADVPEVIFSSPIYGKVVIEPIKDAELGKITACRRLRARAQ